MGLELKAAQLQGLEGAQAARAAVSLTAARAALQCPEVRAHRPPGDCPAHACLAPLGTSGLLCAVSGNPFSV